MKQYTPKQIVAELDKYIVGQSSAKKNVAVALRNRWRRMNSDPEMQKEIVPNNILMIGATGVGKTEIARRLAKLSDAPFVKVEASKFTEVGYVGRDVESMVRDLVDRSVRLVKAEKKEEVRQKAEEAVEKVILDALIPPLRPPVSSNIHPSIASNSAGTSSNGTKELNTKTRERFLEKIKNREMEDREIEIEIRQPQNVGLSMFGSGAMDDVSMMNLQEMFGGMMPKESKKRKVTVEEARKILFEDECAKLIDQDEVKEEALSRAENAGIIFIDEIDKVASSSKKSGGPDVSREGVQRDLLPVVEGSAVNTKHGVVKTDHILFVAAGAFHVSKPSDLIPELQGRFPIRVELENLTKDDFCRILKEPKNSLAKQYVALMKAEGIQLSFQDDALEQLAQTAFDINSELENIGARRLNTVMSHLLNDLLFDVPDTVKPDTKVVITKKMVEEKLTDLVKNKDLSQYIL